MMIGLGGEEEEKQNLLRKWVF